MRHPKGNGAGGVGAELLPKGRRQAVKHGSGVGRTRSQLSASSTGEGGLWLSDPCAGLGPEDPEELWVGLRGQGL